MSTTTANVACAQAQRASIDYFSQMTQCREAMAAFKLAAEADREHTLHWPTLMSALDRLAPSIATEEAFDVAMQEAVDATEVATPFVAQIAPARRSREQLANAHAT